jgi:hypothetical protein
MFDKMSEIYIYIYNYIFMYLKHRATTKVTAGRRLETAARNVGDVSARLTMYKFCGTAALQQ